MADCFCQEDTTQIVLVRELAEYGRCGATHGKAEVNGIAQIDSQCQSVNDKEHALTHLLIDGCLLLMQREQHHHSIGDIGHQNSTGIEHQSTLKDFSEVSQLQTLLEIAVVHQ